MPVVLTDAEYLVFRRMANDYEAGNLFPRLTRKDKPPLITRKKGLVILAKTQEAAQVDGKISVKKLDGSNNVTGDAFDVFVFSDGAATDFTSGYFLAHTGAVMAEGDYIKILKGVDGNWYMVEELIKVTTITVQTNYQIDGPNKEFEKKVRANVYVLATDAESGWTVIHTGEECPP